MGTSVLQTREMPERYISEKLQEAITDEKR